MCTNWENGAKWPILRKSARATSAGLRTPARWPTSARADRALVCTGGVARSLRFGTVSNALGLLSPV